MRSPPGIAPHLEEHARSTYIDHPPQEKPHDDPNGVPLSSLVAPRYPLPFSCCWCQAYTGEWIAGQCRYYTYDSFLVGPSDDLHVTTSVWVASNFGVFGTLELSGVQAIVDVVGPVAENDGTLIVSSGAQLILTQNALVNKGTITLECGGVISGPIQGNPPQHSDACTGGGTETWSISKTAANSAGNSIFHFNPNTAQWTGVDGGAVMATVGRAGRPWIFDKQGVVSNRTKGASGTYVDGKWQSVPGAMTAVAAGADGSVWGIGVQSSKGGNAIYHYNPTAATGWDKVDGGVVEVAVGPPWVVNNQNAAYYRKKGPSGGYLDGTWQLLPGKLVDIAVGADGGAVEVGVAPSGARGSSTRRARCLSERAGLAATWTELGVP